MAGLHVFPGTPRLRKREYSRRFICLALGLVLFVLTGYQIALYNFPTRKLIISDDSQAHYPQSNETPDVLMDSGESGNSKYYEGEAPDHFLESRSNGSQAHGPIPQPVEQPEASMKSGTAVGSEPELHKGTVSTTVNITELQGEVVCNDTCQSEENLTRSRWKAAQMEDYARLFQVSGDPSDTIQGSVETNAVSKNFQMVIKVLAFNRLESLARCLTSLERADYASDNVRLHIFIDHFSVGSDLEARKAQKKSTSAAQKPRNSSPDAHSAEVDDPEKVVPSEEVVEAEKGQEGGRKLLWGFGDFLRKSVVVENKDNLEGGNINTAADTRMDAEVETGKDLEVESETSGLNVQETRETGEGGGGLGTARVREEKEFQEEKKSDFEAQKMAGDQKQTTINAPEYISFRSETEATVDFEITSGVLRNKSGQEVGETQPEKELPPTSATREPELESVDAELLEVHKILTYVDAFRWKHGRKEVHYRTQNVGLQAQWVEAWWPANSDEFAFIVEDDIEVSNLYYRFLRSIIATYYYNPRNFDPSIYGISLQRPRFVPGKGGLPLQVNATSNLFLYQLVGTWGQLLFPEPWKEFRLWYDFHKSKGIKPFLEGMITNSWYKKLGEKIWTPWFVRFVHHRGYFNIYSNFGDERALSISHREPGVNYKKSAGPDSRLVNTLEDANDPMLWVMPPLESVQRYDYCFQNVKVGRLARTVSQFQEILVSLATKRAIVLVNCVDLPVWLVRNWLCQMERLGIRNFLLLGDDEMFMTELARRGYATMPSQLFTELDEEQRDRGANHHKRDLIAVQAVQGVLSLGFSVYLTRADTLWIQNPLDFIVNLTGDPEVDIAGVQPQDRFHPGLLYIKVSQGVLRFWAEVVQKVSSLAQGAPGGTDLEESVWQNFPDFVYSEKICQYRALQSDLCGRFEDIPMNSSMSKKQIVMLDRLEIRPAEVMQRMWAAGFWLIDESLSCKRVYCPRVRQKVKGGRP